MRNRAKNKIFYFSIILTVVLLFCATIIVEKSIYMMNKSTDYLGYQMESQVRDEVGDDLVRYATAVETDVRYNNIKTVIPDSIFRKYINIFDDRRDISSIYIINVGYSFNNANENKIIEDIVGQIPNGADKSQVKDILKKLMVKLKESETKNTTININDLLENSITEISDLSHLNKQEVQNILFKGLFINNKIVLRTNDNNSTETQLNKNEMDKLLSTNSWNEWIAIPKGYLGVNNEAYVEQGKPNLNYNKYIVIASLNKDKILGPYNVYKQKANKISTSLLVILIIFFILALVSCATKFVQIIDRGDEIVPVVKSHNPDHDDDAYKLFDRIHSKFK